MTDKHCSKYLVFLLLMITSVLSAREVSYPSYSRVVLGEVKDYGAESEIVLTAVKTDEAYTKLTFEYRHARSGRCSDLIIYGYAGLMYPAESSYKFLPLKGANGIPVLMELERFELPKKHKVSKGDVETFDLWFPPMPADVDKFDLVGMGLFFIVDIDLSRSGTEDEQVIGSVDKDEVLTPVTFLGGNINDFSKWVNQRLVYPPDCQAAGIEGTVMFNIIVTPEGKPSSILLKGAHTSLNAEANRVVNQSPDWTPFTFRGVPLKTQFQLPVKFILR
ncbi:MAG: energy transducer TonB [Bacteroidales bacterium]|nr:energy transducer TonB [Bacteroidales bacterium]